MDIPTKLKIAVVCSSNQNRSMEAHDFLSKRGFNVRSFGTGNQVKLPGPALNKPNLYNFDVTYQEIYADLERKDRRMYTQNGVLHMLDRNRRIKPKPERFQDAKDKFDVIITVEEKVYDAVIEVLESRPQEGNEAVHVVNIEIRDNHEEATLGAFLICDFCSALQESDDLDNDMDLIVQDFADKIKKIVLHTICFY
uniref:RNA polymerase II subunit A C-terminal domain phosphatase SSU72 n=2 Tax=Macrostomum lignano TaxID=282301 RepID=A0A1I8ID43_9PLAT